ncbi:MAG: hypothetical protein OEW84_07555 [Aigarchaeota archaeon]|nr:hypothetical protein [Aigarchaeota archaeon]
MRSMLTSSQGTSHVLEIEMVPRSRERIFRLFRPREVIQEDMVYIGFNVTNVGESLFPGGDVSIRFPLLSTSIRLPRIKPGENVMIQLDWRDHQLDEGPSWLVLEAVRSDDRLPVIAPDGDKRWAFNFTVTTRNEIRNRYAGYVQAAGTVLALLISIIAFLVARSIA